jgi:hypothetical protein
MMTNAMHRFGYIDEGEDDLADNVAGSISRA